MNSLRDTREWLAIAQEQLALGEIAPTKAILARALSEHPHSSELRRMQAGVLQKIGRNDEAESLLRGLLKDEPGDVASSFALANLLKEQGRTAAAASIVSACLAEPSNHCDANLSIYAIELLIECDRKAHAVAVAEGAIEANPGDSRLHAYAGMLLIQLGEFEKARQHYLFVIEHDPRAWEWHVGIGLASAQRYRSHEHPDFALLGAGLRLESTSDKARAELHFALGKAHDDVGDFEQAARHFREGNAIARRSTRWSRKAWRRAIEARWASDPIAHSLQPFPGFTPVFIVGMPRSGTTLLAELLSRHPRVSNRGELPWIAKLAGLPALTSHPDRVSLEDAAATYAARSRQDDSGDAHWFIDKQPLNFRYVDLMLALFPNAKVLHCQRSPRDTALSLWMQCFLEDVQGYSYEFPDIKLVMRDCERLMGRWRARWPDSIRTVQYEELVTDTHRVIDALAQWMEFPAYEAAAHETAASISAVSTASLWQVRQPVNSRSIGRWRNYADRIPELLQFPEGTMPVR